MALKQRSRRHATPADAAAAAEAAHHGPSGQDFKPSPAGWTARGVVMALIAMLVLVVPLMRDLSEVRIYALAVIYAIIGLSLNVLLGYTGQISLGHQAFVGIGAFASAYMVSVQQQPFFLAVAVAMAIGGFQALVLGGVSLRIRGLYFALITLSYGIMAEQTLFQIEKFTGGSAGQPAPLPSGFETPYKFYYLCLAFLAAVVWVDWRLMRTKGGRALLALRENPRVAATLGIDVKLYTLCAFVVAGVFAGLGGALFAHNSEFVVSNSYEFRLALIFVIMTTVGGLRSRTGVIVGSAFFALLGYLIEKEYAFPVVGWHLNIETILQKLPGPDLTAEIAPLVLGPALLLLTLIQYPGGIGQQLRPLTGWLRGNRFNIHDRGEKEVNVADVRA
jgi:branched-chain amino acid transport system permease protein